MKPLLFEIAIVVFLPTAFVAAQTEKAGSARPVDLASLRATYHDELRKIDEADKATRLSLENEYLKIVEAIEKKLQTAAKLDELLDIRRERERFVGQRTIGENDLVASVPELKTCQGNFIKQAEGLPIARARRIVTLAQQYERSLIGMEQTLTRNGELLSALDAKKEREGLPNRDEIKDAQALIAEADARARAEAEAAKKAAASTAVSTGSSKKPESAAKKYVGKAEAYIQVRFDKFFDAIVRQKWDEALTLVDPEFLKRRGQDEVLLRLRYIFPFIRMLEDIPGSRFKAGAVTMDADGKGATLIPRLWVNNRWHEHPAMRWVEVEGDWFVEIEEPIRRRDEEPGPGDFPRGPRRMFR